MKRFFISFILVCTFFLSQTIAYAELITKSFGHYSFGHDMAAGTFFLSVTGATKRTMEQPKIYKELLLITNAIYLNSKTDIVFIVFPEKIDNNYVDLVIYTGKNYENVFNVRGENINYSTGKTQLIIRSEEATHIFKLILDHNSKIVLNDKTYYFVVDLENTKKMTDYLENFKKNFRK